MDWLIGYLTLAVQALEGIFCCLIVLDMLVFYGAQMESYMLFNCSLVTLKATRPLRHSRSVRVAQKVRFFIYASCMQDQVQTQLYDMKYPCLSD